MVTGHSVENRYHLLPEKNISPTPVEENGILLKKASAS
jgi:hypothetical protein